MVQAPLVTLNPETTVEPGVTHIVGKLDVAVAPRLVGLCYQHEGSTGVPGATYTITLLELGKTHAAFTRHVTETEKDMLSGYVSPGRTFGPFSFAQPREVSLPLDVSMNSVDEVANVVVLVHTTGLGEELRSNYVGKLHLMVRGYRMGNF